MAGFARQCLSTSTGWSTHWVKRSNLPAAPVHIYQPRARQIDRVLSEQLPEYIGCIKLAAGD
jgi:hypothetical protein